MFCLYQKSTKFLELKTGGYALAGWTLQTRQWKKKNPDNSCSRWVKGWGWQIFSVKSQIVNILGFVGHTASVPTTQPWSYSMKVATESIGTDGHNCVPVKHYLQKWAGGKNWAMGSSLPTSNIDLYYLIGSIEGWRVNPVHALRTVPYTP